MTNALRIEKFGDTYSITFCVTCVNTSCSNFSKRLARSSKRGRLFSGSVSRKLERVSQTESGELSLSSGNAAFKSFSRLKIRWHEITPPLPPSPCWPRYNDIKQWNPARDQHFTSSPPLYVRGGGRAISHFLLPPSPVFETLARSRTFHPVNGVSRKESCPSGVGG